MSSIEQDLAVRRRRVNPILVAALILVVLVVLWFAVVSPLFFPGTEEPAPPAAIPATPAEPEPAAPPVEAPPETFEVFESKDPFRPLVVEGAPPGATVTAGTAANGQTATTTNATGAAGAPAPSGGQRVSLLSIFEEESTSKAQIKVGSTVYTVAPGEVFANNFKLVSISGRCATLLHGDDKFTLCEGEEVIK